jgi:apolipoprotein N-acyltransferase
VTSPKLHPRARYLLLSALLLTLAQPPFPTGWLAYIALVPYLVGLEGLRGRKAFGYGFLWGCCVNLLGIYWIGAGAQYVGPAMLGAFVAAVIYLALLDGLFTLLLSQVRTGSRGYVLPFLWTGFIFLKSAGQMGFPWLCLALTQTYTPAAIQTASLAGAWLVDFWVAGINGLTLNALPRILKAIPERRGASLVQALAPPAGIALLVLLYGRLVLGLGGAAQSSEFTQPAGAVQASATAEAEGSAEPVPPWLPTGSRPLKVASIQGSLVPSVKLKPHLLFYNTYVYERLSRAALAAAGGDLDLIVWPESAVPQSLNSRLAVNRETRRIQAELGVPLITGAFAYFRDADGSGGQRFYNAAFLLSGTYISTGEAVYGKRLLVPFGERVPYQKLLGFLAGWSMGWSDFSMGTSAPLFGGGAHTPGIPPIGVQICYESVFSRLVRPQVVDGAQVLAVITNDAWFGRTSGPHQHLMAAALRAVEFRRPVIRSANSGISGFIDRWGQVHETTPLFVKTATIGCVWPEESLTLYARTGDWLPVAALLLSLVALFVLKAPREGIQGSKQAEDLVEYPGT